jgi:hypothetical protein
MKVAQDEIEEVVVSRSMVSNRKGGEKTRVLKEQIKVFVMTYIGYVAVHLFREFWAMSKKSMINQAE